jgi:hypothetical protein
MPEIPAVIISSVFLDQSNVKQLVWIWEVNSIPLSSDRSGSVGELGEHSKQVEQASAIQIISKNLFM